MFNSVKPGVAARHSTSGPGSVFFRCWVHFVSTFFLFFPRFGLKRPVSLARPPAARAVVSVVDIDLSVAIWVLFCDSSISTAAEKIADAGGCDCAANQRRRAAGVELAVPEVYFCAL
jgi:hypothetical protein